MQCSQKVGQKKWSHNLSKFPTQFKTRQVPCRIRQVFRRGGVDNYVFFILKCGIPRNPHQTSLSTNPSHQVSPPRQLDTISIELKYMFCSIVSINSITPCIGIVIGIGIVFFLIFDFPGGMPSRKIN